MTWTWNQPCIRQQVQVQQKWPANMINAAGGTDKNKHAEDNTRG